MEKSIKSKEGTFPVRDGKIYFRIFGKGKPIFIVHGGPGFDHRHMLPLKDLAGDYQVVFYDQRGSGNSVSPVDSLRITVAQFVEDLERLRQTLGPDKITIIGHSWGATLAIHYAIKYSRHLEAMVLLAPGGGSSEFYGTYFENIRKRFRPEDQQKIQAIQQSDGFIRKEPEVLQEYFGLSTKPLFYNPSRIDELDLSFLPNTAQNIFEIGQLLLKDLGDFDIHSRLSVIRCPVLLVHGEGDPFPVEGPKRLQEFLPQSDLLILKNTGHFMFIEARRELFFGIREFLMSPGLGD